MTDRTVSPSTRWEDCDGSCDCHIGICMDCGCTNEREPQPEKDPGPIPAEPR